MSEVEREAHTDLVTPPNLAAVSAQWSRVSDAIHATVALAVA